jgi:deoxyribonuclease-4
MRKNTTNLLLGMHVSISGSLGNAVDNAKILGCTAFQIFTRNPRGWMAQPLSTKEITDFRSKIKAYNMDKCPIFAHMPYPPNFSSPEKIPFKKSMQSLIQETKRCSELGIPYLVAHLGTHRGVGSTKGVETVVEAFYNAVKKTPDNVTILLENNVGNRHSVGSNFEEFMEIFSHLEKMKRFGVCFDTCHAFTSGYEMQTAATAKKTLEDFANLVGIKNIKLIHLNDSQGKIGCGIDVHEHIGLGHIGKKGLEYCSKFAKSNNIPIILETPIDERRDDLENLQIVKNMF